LNRVELLGFGVQGLGFMVSDSKVRVHLRGFYVAVFWELPPRFRDGD